MLTPNGLILSHLGFRCNKQIIFPLLLWIPARGNTGEPRLVSSASCRPTHWPRHTATSCHSESLRSEASVSTKLVEHVCVSVFDCFHDSFSKRCVEVTHTRPHADSIMIQGERQGIEMVSSVFKGSDRESKWSPVYLRATQCDAGSRSRMRLFTVRETSSL